MKTVKGDFVHLHLHSQYSLLDGAIRFPQLFERLTASGVNSVALTDHGNMYGAIDFYEQAKHYDIHAVIGCEIYVAPESRLIKKKISRKDTSNHLVLLARNQTGYQNLIRLVSLAFMEGFYYKPRIDHELLEKYHEGIIALSACLKGEVPTLILNNQMDEARERLRYYKNLFGKGNFYVEVQKNGIPEQEKVNDVILEMARGEGIPPVATNDCHYLEREDAKAHEVLLCLQTGKTLTDTSRMKFQTNEFYVKTPEEMITAFSNVPEAIENTLKIAEKCDVNLDFKGYHFPAITLQKDLDHETYLRKKAEEGLEAYFKRMDALGKPVDEAVYRERLHYELETIIEMGFADYFLIVSDFIGYARENKIPVGPGRGSAAGSLVSFTLGITEIDPIPYKLLFERFLTPGRVTMPDIDCDFSDEKRDLVIQYVTEKYGHDRVAQITTFSAMRAKAVVRDVGRVMGLPYGEVDQVAKLIPDTPKVTLEDAFEQEPKLREAVSMDQKIADLFRVARTLEGLNRHNSTHAAGVVISGKPLMELLPLCLGKKDEILTQYDMNCVQTVGLVKFDFLGLATLSVMDRTVVLIRQAKDPEFDLKNIDLKDKATYSLLKKGDVLGIFQLESSSTARDLVTRVKPKTFEDIIDLVALNRPGPLESGMVDAYIKRRFNKKLITYDIPELEEVLDDTYGVILYQEQVMQIAMKLGGFTSLEADKLRKAMGKKKADEMAKLRDKFVEGAEKNGIDVKKAEKLYDQMAQFAKYGFNKSHSTAYALIAFQTAYLKAHYLTEFMTAILNTEINKPEKLTRYIDGCKDMNIEVLPPDVNKSGLDFTVEGEKIRFGLAGVKNVGQGAAQLIEQERKNKGVFASILDFCSRLDLRKVNKRVLESLIKCGAFDAMGISRARLFAALDEILDIAQREQKQRKSRQKSLFGDGNGSAGGGLSEDYVYPDIEEWPQSKRLLYEKELLGIFLTGHPLMAFEEKLKTLGVTAIGDVTRKLNRKKVKIAGVVVVSKEITTKKGNERMAFVTIEDHTGTMEVLVFPSVFKTVAFYLLPDTALFVEGTVDMSGDMAKVKAVSIMPLEDAEKVKPIHIHISADQVTSENIFAFKHLLEECRGQHPVYMHLAIEASREAIIALPEHLYGLDTPEFLGSVGNIFGETSKIEI
jgi:DNA polymerase-3 subunit alpha